MLDFVFTKLGIDTDRIDHPIVMTEALCNPHYTRGREFSALPHRSRGVCTHTNEAGMVVMSELLFEGYSVPSLTYGVDSLFAFHASPNPTDGLVVSSSAMSTTVIPVLNGRGVLANAKK